MQKNVQISYELFIDLIKFQARVLYEIQNSGH